MLARARAQGGFTTVELLLAVMISSVGIISLVGTFDVSRRATTYNEMKETASHLAEQKMEELRAVPYDELALNGNPSPASSSDPTEPPYYVGSDGAGGATYRWNQKSNAPAGHTEPLVIDATDGQVPAVAESWSDGRLEGKIYRYITCAPSDAGGTATADDCKPDAASPAYKRVTVAVTVDNSFGPQSPILVSGIVGKPIAGEGNPLDDPNTQCEDENGVLIECQQGVDGTVHSYYLYDTPATFSAREEIAGNHTTHPTVAPSGTCTSSNTSGCPVPDLMAMDPPPAPDPAPPLYNYSSEVTGGSTPGGAVVRRDAECSGNVTSTDNTKGHMWVTAPLAAPMTLSGDAALMVSTQTFNGATAAAMLCVRFYNVPGDISNLVANPPVGLGSAGYSLTNWARTPAPLSFAMDFLGSDPNPTIPAGNRLGVRVWAAASSAADLVVIYDHPSHVAMVQVNEAG